MALEAGGCEGCFGGRVGWGEGYGGVGRGHDCQDGSAGQYVGGCMEGDGVLVVFLLDLRHGCVGEDAIFRQGVAYLVDDGGRSCRRPSQHRCKIGIEDQGYKPTDHS